MTAAQYEECMALLMDIRLRIERLERRPDLAAQVEAPAGPLAVTLPASGSPVDVMADARHRGLA